MPVYGSARVSTDGQTIDAQVARLKAAGVSKVFKEKVSAVRADRAQLHKAIALLGPDDVLPARRLDHLARSTRDLLNILHEIASKWVGYRSPSDTWADTTMAHGHLMLPVLPGLAEFERELICVRTGDGRERAKARGVSLGRKPKLTPHQKRETIMRRNAGESLAKIKRSCNVSHSMISRLRE